MEEESGQVFVYTLEPIPDVLTLSVITNCGVQDLEISFESRSSEVVILENPDDICETSNSMKSPKEQMNNINEIIESILRGSVSARIS